MRTAVLFALLAASGLAVRIETSTLRQDPNGVPPADLDPKLVVDGSRAWMEQRRTDFQAQAIACNQLHTFSQEGREDPGLGGNRVADKWLTAGLYEVMAQGLLNILAVPEGAASEDELFLAASACFSTIGGATIRNHERKAILMCRNSPHLWDAVVGYFERFKTKLVVPGGTPLCFFAGFYGNWGPNERDSLSEISRGLDRAGGFKFILDVLEHNYTDPTLFHGAACALSDHLVGSTEGARIIADNNDGIRLLTNGVRHAQGAYPFHEGSGSGFGLKYQILEDVTGLLKNDDNGRFAKGFLEEGLMEEVIKLMPEEPNDLYFQDHCCQVFNWLTNSNPSAQHELAHSAAAQLVQKVVTEPCAPACKWPAPVTKFGSFDGNWAHLTDSDPSPSCMFLHSNLLQFSQGNTHWKDWSMLEYQP